jgi:hypothetical protein
MLSDNVETDWSHAFGLTDKTQIDHHGYDSAVGSLVNHIWFDDLKSWNEFYPTYQNRASIKS